MGIRRIVDGKGWGRVLHRKTGEDLYSDLVSMQYSSSSLPGRSSIIACFLIVGSTLLSGCNVEKARTLQGAAVQFRAESLAAIQAIDTMHKAELAPPPRAPAEVRRDFVNGILNSRSEINSNLGKTRSAKLWVSGSK